MAINKKLLDASTKYIRNGKTSYTIEDAVCFRCVWGKSLIPKKNSLPRLKRAVGGVLLGYGALTIWCPFSFSFATITAGGGLLKSSGVDVWKHYKNLKQKANPILSKVGLL